ncbi:MAG: hypothetical protein ABEK01_05620 [Candidatus Nanohaloarchaea archaeon]
MKVRFIGPYSSGKTTIIKMLKESTELMTKPTPAYKKQGTVEMPFIGDVDEESFDEEGEVALTELGGQEEFWEKHRDNVEKFIADVDLLVGVFNLKKPEDDEEYQEELERYRKYIESFLVGTQESDRDIHWGFMINQLTEEDLEEEKYMERLEDIEGLLEDVFSDHGSDYVVEKVYGMESESARRAFFSIYFEYADQEKVMNQLCDEIGSLIEADAVTIVNEEGIILGESGRGGKKLAEKYGQVGEIFRRMETGDDNVAVFSDAEGISGNYLKPGGKLDYSVAFYVEMEEGPDAAVIMHPGMHLNTVLLRLGYIQERLYEIIREFLNRE